MNTRIPFCATLLLAVLLAGCAESVPEALKPTGGSNARVTSSPQERIKNIESDASLTPAEKAMRIKAVKERNHIP